MVDASVYRGRVICSGVHLLYVGSQGMESSCLPGHKGPNEKNSIHGLLHLGSGWVWQQAMHTLTT